MSVQKLFQENSKLMSISGVDFNEWWDKEGSKQNKKEDENCKKFVYDMCEIAWLNGAYKTFKAYTELAIDVDKHDSNTLIAAAGDIVIELQRRGFSIELIEDEIVKGNIV